MHPAHFWPPAPFSGCPQGRQNHFRRFKMFRHVISSIGTGLDTQSEFLVQREKKLVKPFFYVTQTFDV